MVCVVGVAVVAGQGLGLGEGRELLDIEQLIAQAGVEGLDPGVLPGRARIDVGSVGEPRLAPLGEHPGGQLRAVVGAQVRRRPAALGDQALEDHDGLISVDRAPALDRQGLAGELVDDVEELQLAAVSSRVMLEVQRPDVIGVAGAKPVGGRGRVSEPAPLSGLARHPQALLAPDPLGALAVEIEALEAQLRVSAAIAPARMHSRDPTQTLTQRLIVAGDLRLVALGRSMLARDLARPTLGKLQPFAEHANRLAPPGRAQKFPGMKMADEGPGAIRQRA